MPLITNNTIDFSNYRDLLIAYMGTNARSSHNSFISNHKFAGPNIVERRCCQAGNKSLIQERTILLSKERSRRSHAYSAKGALKMAIKIQRAVENILIQATCVTQAVEEYKHLWNTMLRLPSKRYSTPYLLTRYRVIACCDPHTIPREKHSNLISLLVSNPNSSNRRMLLGVVGTLWILVYLCASVSSVLSNLHQITAGNIMAPEARLESQLLQLI